MSAILLVLRKFFSIAIGALLKVLVSEKVIIELMVKLGDWLVKRTENDLDNEIWLPLREQLERNLSPGRKVTG